MGVILGGLVAVEYRCHDLANVARGDGSELFQSNIVNVDLLFFQDVVKFLSNLITGKSGEMDQLAEEVSIWLFACPFFCLFRNRFHANGWRKGDQV